jgi:hypothetical protein
MRCQGFMNTPHEAVCSEQEDDTVIITRRLVTLLTIFINDSPMQIARR